MSKLIVEMDMPTRCPCVLAVDNIGWFSPCFADHGIPSRTKDFDNCIEKGTRPDWCPIKGELPEEHGDLIDRSLLCADLIGVILSHSRLDVGEVIARQNAVIPAEMKLIDESNGLREIEKAWGQYIERERDAEKIAVEEELNRRRRELEEIKAEKEKIINDV